MFLLKIFGSNMSKNVELELVSLTKRYGAMVAVDAISYHLAQGLTRVSWGHRVRQVVHTEDDCRA